MLGRSYLFEDVLRVSQPLGFVLEDLTYDQIFRMSEPKRYYRSQHVHMPPLEVEAYQTADHWVFAYYFNAKSDPGHSTTGLRHRGAIRFRKPKRKHTGKNTPLSKLSVEVDCMCPDYRYRWAWANHQKRAGPIGSQSLNQCIRRAPRKTNPTGQPGLCKHLLATRDYIYGLLSGFPQEVGPSDRLDKLTKRATKRWLNFDAEMAAARERDAQIALAKARRNIGVPPERQNRLPNRLDVAEPPPLPEIPAGEPTAPAPWTPWTGGLPTAATPPKPPQPPKPPAGKSPPPTPKKPGAKPTKPKPKSPPGENPNTAVKGLSPEQFLGRRFLKTEGVDSMSNMKKTLTLEEARPILRARKVIVEMEDDFSGGLGGMDGMDDMPPASGSDMPLEPPVSDSAVGASTEDNVALGLLREIRDLIADLVADEAAEGGEAPEIPEEELEPGQGGEEDRLGGDEEFKPGKRPMPVPTGAGGE